MAMATSVRIFALLTLVALGGYYVLRALATQCSGLQCDAYIIPSALVPLLAVILAAATGILAITAARQTGSVWVWILGLCTALGVIGPFVSLAILRDQPDAFVPVATALVALIPVAALVYTFVGGGAAHPSGAS